MKISKDRFERIISSYLDGECSPAEAQQLLDCISANKNLRGFFLRACAMHKAMCRLYGKDPKLPKLASFDVEEFLAPKRVSRFKAISEWTAVAGFFACCAVFMTLALESTSADAAESEDILAADQFDDTHYETYIDDKVDTADGEISIIKVFPKYSVLLP